MNNVQSTRLRAKNHFTFSNYTVIRKDRINRPGGGVALLVKSTIEHSVLNWLDDLETEALAVRVTGNNHTPPVDIIVYYNPPGTRLDRRLFQTVRNKSNRFCIHKKELYS